MFVVVRKLSLGVGLVVCCSGLLLGWDYLEHRARHDKPRVAIFQQASTPVLDDCVRGMIEGLESAGFKDGENLELSHYNAENDNSMANAIAHQVTDGSFDLVLTSSTPALQIVAAANESGRVLQVFGAVADPYAAGVGLDRNDPLHHPRNLVGYGTLLPVDSTFQLARRLYPGLRKVGVAHNPAETNSRVFVTMARETCQKLGIELVEAPVENSASVKEAIDSVIARGAEAIWIGGDNTVSSVTDTVVSTAKRGRIPVFSMLPGGKPDRGTLFDLGVDFVQVGRMSGELAGRLLKGADPTKIPVGDVIDQVSKRLTFNATVLKDLKGPWQLPPSVREQVDILVDENGIHQLTPTKKLMK
ncbi:MAG TPA: ABC transporter substrate-binding protein [Gemmataceae bacterium]|jgi:putative ABC transport system substrate-binding protein|nr:ABC transporter substrate-binding protein [Gemmataceae bacterium]